MSLSIVACRMGRQTSMGGYDDAAAAPEHKHQP